MPVSGSASLNAQAVLIASWPCIASTTNSVSTGFSAACRSAISFISASSIARLMKLLTRRGVLVEEEGSTYMTNNDNDGDSDEARVLRPLQAAACTYRISFGPRTG